MMLMLILILVLTTIVVVWAGINDNYLRQKISVLEEKIKKLEKVYNVKELANIRKNDLRSENATG